MVVIFPGSGGQNRRKRKFPVALEWWETALLPQIFSTWNNQPCWANQCKRAGFKWFFQLVIGVDGVEILQMMATDRLLFVAKVAPVPEALVDCYMCLIFGALELSLCSFQGIFQLQDWRRRRRNIASNNGFRPIAFRDRGCSQTTHFHPNPLLSVSVFNLISYNINRISFPFFLEE